MANSVLHRNIKRRGLAPGGCVDELEQLAKRIREMNQLDTGPFPYEDIRALRQVFAEDFERLSPDDCFNADLDHFLWTIYDWSSGDVRKLLPDAGNRYRAKLWFSKSFFERFPQYAFLQPYDLSEYPLLHQHLEIAERLRCMLLQAISLYETSNSIPE